MLEVAGGALYVVACRSEAAELCGVFACIFRTMTGARVKNNEHLIFFAVSDTVVESEEKQVIVFRGGVVLLLQVVSGEVFVDVDWRFAPVGSAPYYIDAIAEEVVRQRLVEIVGRFV